MSPLTVQGTVSLSSEERSWLEVWRKSEACATFEQEKKQLPLEGPDETKEEGFATSSDEDGIGETPITPITPITPTPITPLSPTPDSPPKERRRSKRKVRKQQKVKFKKKKAKGKKEKDAQTPKKSMYQIFMTHPEVIRRLAIAKPSSFGERNQMIGRMWQECKEHFRSDSAAWAAGTSCLRIYTNSIGTDPAVPSARHRKRRKAKTASPERGTVFSVGHSFCR